MTMHFPRESAKVHPPSLFPYYTSTIKRAPKRPLIILPHTETELTAPAYGHEVVRPEDADLTRQHEGEPLGQRIIVPHRPRGSPGRGRSANDDEDEDLPDASDCRMDRATGHGGLCLGECATVSHS